MYRFGEKSARPIFRSAIFHPQKDRHGLAFQRTQDQHCCTKPRDATVRNRRNLVAFSSQGHRSEPKLPVASKAAPCASLWTLAVIELKLQRRLLIQQRIGLIIAGLAHFCHNSLTDPHLREDPYLVAASKT